MKYFLVFLPFLSCIGLAQERGKMSVTFTDGTKTERTENEFDQQ